MPAHALFFIKELQHQPIIQHLCIAKVQTKTNVLCADAWRWRDVARDRLRRTRWWVPWSCMRDGSLARAITGLLVDLMQIGGACYRSRPRSGLAAPINPLRDPRALLAPRQDASLRRLDPSLGHPTCRRGLRRPFSEGGRSWDRLVARGRRGGGGRRTRG